MTYRTLLSLVQAMQGDALDFDVTIEVNQDNGSSREFFAAKFVYQVSKNSDM